MDIKCIFKKHTKLPKNTMVKSYSSGFNIFLENCILLKVF